MEVYNILLQIAAFEMIPVEFLTEDMAVALEAISVDPKAEKFEFIGFNGVWIIPNLGSMLLLIALFPFKLLLLPLISLLARHNRRMKIWRKRLGYSLWN